MDYKKLVLFVIFIISISFLYQNWQAMLQKERVLHPAVSTQQVGDSVGVVGATSAEQTRVPTVLPSTVSSSSSSSSSSAAPVDAFPAAPSHPLVWIETDVVRVGFNPQGGSVESVALKNIHRSLKDRRSVILLSHAEGEPFYIAESGLASIHQMSYPNHTTLYQVLPGTRTLLPGQDVLRLTFSAKEHGVQLQKTYVFHRGSYEIELHQKISNDSGAPLTPVVYFQLLRDASVPPAVSKFVSTFTGPALYTEEDKFHKLSFSQLDEQSVPFSRHSAFGWASFIQHYFVSAWVPQQPRTVTLYADRVQNGLYRIGFQQALPLLKAGGVAETSTVLYAGPQREALLAHVHDSFDLVRDYGWLTFISKPLFWILNIFHDLVGNWGWSIVLLTLLVKLIFFPLSAASYRSMAKMKLLGPAMQLIRTRYAEDKAKQQQEMMALFKKEKVNPMLGCLPMLVQIPVFIALYYVLVESAELRQAPWLFWIQDLSARDPFYILPIILAVTTFIQVRLNPSAGDPTQARMMMIMPMIFSIMFFFFPAGLVLYWFVSNLFSLVQQWYMTRVVHQLQK